MNETIPDKEAYQTNRRRMCWAALGMMIACTARLFTILYGCLRLKASSWRIIWRCLVWWVLTLRWGIRAGSRDWSNHWIA